MSNKELIESDILVNSPAGKPDYSSSDESSSSSSDSESYISSDSESYTSSESSICADEKNDLENELNEEDYEYEHVIGIDLGTSNSVVAIYRNDQVEIIPDEYGHKIIPSYVAYTSGMRYVGHDAKNQTELNPKNVFYETKRLIGRKFTDDIIENEKEFRTYNISKDNKGSITVVSNITVKNPNTNEPELKNFTPEEIAAAILTKLKNMASDYLKTPITKAVITIPANFNDGQRQATKDAAKIAGLDCIRLINEPTAAGIAYGILTRTEESSEKRLTLVYDFGGGTLDVALMEIENGNCSVISTAGNMRFGGSDFDTRLIQYCVGRFERMNHLPKLVIPSLSMQKLKRECENAKKKLSNFTKTYIVVSKFYDDIDLCICLKRNDMEKLLSDLLLLCLKPVDDILKINELTESDIDDVILVGGMTRMPKIRNLVKSKFGKDPICNINPDEAIAAGAAIDAYIASHRRDPLKKNIKVQDVVSMSLGVEVNGGIMDSIIHKNDGLPCSAKKRYNPDQDYVDSVLIKIYEGERSLTQGYNFFVGEFELSGIEKAPKGSTEIEVKFSIDENGIISVSAENLKTNDFTEIIVTSNKNRLTKEEIEKFIEESKELEFKDLEIKGKKMACYEIEDSCSNILLNILPSEYSKLSVNDREKITDDVNGILNWVREKKITEREYKEYEDIIKQIRDRYGVLMLKGNIEENKVVDREENNKNISTDVFGNDDNTDQIDEVHEKMAEEFLQHIGLDDPEKKDLEDLKESIINLCYEINQIINNNNLNMSVDHIKELKEYIDDSLLWMYTHNETVKKEFIEKMNEINDTCNKFMDHYTGEDKFIKNPIVVSNSNKRIELENLCIMIKLLISKKEFPGSNKILEKSKKTKKIKKNYNNLLKILEESLKFIYIQENEKINNKSFDEDKYYNECDNFIDKINAICNKIYDSMTGIDFENNIIIDSKKEEIISSTNLSGPVIKENIEMGTSILSIRRDMQKNIIDEMINKLDDDSDNEKHDVKNESDNSDDSDDSDDN